MGAVCRLPPNYLRGDDVVSNPRYQPQPAAGERAFRSLLPPRGHKESDADPRDVRYHTYWRARHVLGHDIHLRR